MNTHGRTSSNSPTGNDIVRGVRPPPPVRPKPKRTITAPILMDGRPEIRVIDGENTGCATVITSKELPSDSTPTVFIPSLPSKGTVKALAERFEIPRQSTSAVTIDAISLVRSTVEIFEAEIVTKESNRQKPLVGASGRSKSLSKFTKTTINADHQAPVPKCVSAITSNGKQTGDKSIIPKEIKDSKSKAIRNHQDSLNTSLIKKRDSLERSRRSRQNGQRIKESNNGIVQTSSICLPKTRLSLFGNCFKTKNKLRRSRSCDLLFDKRFNRSVGSQGKRQRKERGNSLDWSHVFITSTKDKKLIRRMLSPPAVPPKPGKLSLPISMHDYAEYDILPSNSPAAVFNGQAVSKKQQNCDRKILQVVDRLQDGFISPSSLYDSPRCSKEVRSDVSATTPSTMDFFDESQLNISGHIYCAVRNGEVIEDEYDDVMVNRNSNMLKSQLNGDQEDDDDSFAAAVFDAIELATGKRIAIDENGDRQIEEDAITNYEEIMDDFEDAETATAKDDDTEEITYGKFPSPKIQTDSRDPIDQSYKWETCSSLTSTSAESGSSSNNAPMLIAFRRRTSTDRRNEDELDNAAKRVTEDLSNNIELPDNTASRKTTNSYSFVPDERTRDTKSAPRGDTRPIRTKSQFDMAANSLWRIKSDIQLNLSKAIGKIHLKVSSGASADGQLSNGGKSECVSNDTAPESKKSEHKARSKFYLPNLSNVDGGQQKNTAPPHPTSISITLEAGLEDDLVSSTVASSDDEEDDFDWSKHEQEETSNAGVDETTPTNTIVIGQKLPDLVPIGQVSQVMKSSPLKIFRTDDATNSDTSSPSATDRSTSHSTAQDRGLVPNVSNPSCSSTLANGLGDSERFELIYNSRFAFSEPLYQHYRSQTTMVQRQLTFSEGDGKMTISRRDQLLNASQLGSQRTLWCELPEVQCAGLLERLSDEERKLQEAMFELITSEASYLRSLNILITQFLASPHLSGNIALGSVITKQDRKHLFSNILSVRDCSERLLCALESRFEENVLLVDVCDLLYEHLRSDCEVYVKYCANQIYQERTLNELRRTNSDFRDVVGQLESNPVCECLNLRSFLMLPMQRVTRYPLLVAAILHRTEENSQCQATAQRAYGMARRVVRQCNEGAKRLERIEQLVELDQTLIYREGGPKRVALVSGSRWLIKKGLVINLLQRRHTLGVRGGIRHRRIYLFLFTDLLLITKPVDGEKRFVVKDYCQRQFVEVSPLEPSCPQVPEGANLPANSRLVLCTLMKNHRGRQVQMVFNCVSETDKNRWLDAIRPPSAEEDGIYESWDCPQVRVISEYHAVQADELDLEVGEIINVLRKMQDGWYEGERQRDGEKGWFPGNLTEEILSDHVRAKNYRDRLRFINEAELLQRNIYTADGAGIVLPYASTGTTGRRNSIIPTAAKALFRL